MRIIKQIKKMDAIQPKKEYFITCSLYGTYNFGNGKTENEIINRNQLYGIYIKELKYLLGSDIKTLINTLNEIKELKIIGSSEIQMKKNLILDDFDNFYVDKEGVYIIQGSIAHKIIVNLDKCIEFLESLDSVLIIKIELDN